MKVYLDSNISLLEYIYLTTKELHENEDEDSLYSLVSSIDKASIVIGCSPQSLYYDKTIIINNENYDKDNLVDLSKFNKIISRFQLPVGLIQDYELVPYDKLKLNEFRFNGKSNTIMSKLSIDKFIILKDDDGYYMKYSDLFLSHKVKGDLTIIGLLKYQLECQKN